MADSNTVGSEASQGIPFGPRKLNLRIGSDISKGNMLTLLFGSFFGIAMMGFVNASQPYLFSEVLNIPPEDQAPLAGHLTFLSEIVVIATIGIIGAMSDKIGRTSRSKRMVSANMVWHRPNMTTMVKAARKRTGDRTPGSVDGKENANRYRPS